MLYMGDSSVGLCVCNLGTNLPAITPVYYSKVIGLSGQDAPTADLDFRCRAFDAADAITSTDGCVQCIMG